MKTVGSYEAKTHLPKLLDEVKNGEQITITKHGVPVAVLQPVKPEKRRKISSVIADLKDFRSKNKLAGLSIREMIEEGRR